VSDYALGKAEGEIVLTYNGAAVTKAQADIAGLGKNSGKASAALQSVGKVSMIAGLAIAGGMALAVRSAANFEQSISGIAAVSGGTAKQMDAVRAKALQLGKDTKYSAGEAADAIQNLSKAGVTLPDILNGAADATVALAAAGEVELPRAAEIASNSMNMFNLTAKQMPHVADLLAGAANASAVSVDDLAMALSQTGAVAHTVGLSIDDTTAAIGILGNAGIKGSDAGTSLKSMLLRLQPVTKKQTALFKELGITTKDGSNQFFDAQGNIKSMAGISGVLQTALQGMTKQQKLATLNTLFGTDAIRASAVFAEKGAVGFDKFSKSMGGIKAADVAAKRMDNLKGDIEQLKGSLETAGIAIGTILIPALRKISQVVTNAANWFLSLSDTQKKWVTGIIAAVGAALLIVGAIIKITFAIQKMVKALGIIKVAMSETWLAALGPIGLVIAILAVIGLALVLLWKKSETARDIMKQCWIGIQVAAGEMSSIVINAFHALLDVVLLVADGIISGMALAFGWIPGVGPKLKAANDAFDKMKSGIDKTLNDAAASASHWGEQIPKALADGIVRGTPSADVAAVQLGVKVKNTLGITATQTNAIGAMAATQYANGIAAKTAYANATASILYNGVMYALHPNDAPYRIGLMVAEQVARGISKKVAEANAAANELAGGVTHPLKDASPTAAHAGEKIAHGLGAGLTKRAPDAGGAAITLVSQVETPMLPMPGVANALGGSIASGLAAGIHDSARLAILAAGTMASGVKYALEGVVQPGSPSKMSKVLGKAIAQGIKVGIDEDAGQIKAAATAFMVSVNEALKKAKVGEKVADDLRANLHKQIVALNDYAKQRDVIADHLATAKGKLQEAMDIRTNFAAGTTGSAQDFASITGITLDQAAIDKATSDVSTATDAQTEALKNQAVAQKALDDATNSGVAMDPAYMATTRQTLADATAVAASATSDLAAAEAVLTGTDQTLDSGDLTAGLQGRLDAIRNYQGLLASLAANGLNQTTYGQLVAAGVDAGTGYAQAILDGGPAAIGNINSIQGQINSAATTMGTDNAAYMYDAGVLTAQGIVKGLQSQEKALTDQMRHIANKIVHMVKKTLGIKSPSRVMFSQAVMMMRGLTDGIDGSADDVYKAMRNVALGVPRAIDGLSAPGLQSATALARAGTQSTDARSYGGDTLNLTALTKADPEEIVDEYMWARRTKLMGGRR
jgi:TP901 family phage tail tape measure protein